MRHIFKVILAILQFVHKNLNDVDVDRRKLLHLKATHPKLYKKAKDEVLAEKLIESLPELAFEEALKAVEDAYKHKG